MKSNKRITLYKKLLISKKISMFKIGTCALIVFLASIKFSLTSKAQGINQDSIVVSFQPEYDSVSTWHRTLFGNSNRVLWATPIKIRILHLKSEKGGMSIVKKGGGMQTKSLRLSDPDGNEYVIRTLQKYPDRKLPENLKHTIVRDILQDQVSAINPFGALAVPPFATALGIPHTDPEIVYLGDDPELKEYKSEFANATYLFERYAPESDNKNSNTIKVQEKLQEDNDQSVDQKIVLRARLLDMVIGDWDRHEGQWRWEKEKNNGESVYTPIPRDRDQVFYKTSGLFPWIVSHQWLKSRFQPYEGKLRDVKGWNFGAKDFDRYFLNSLDRKDWEKEIKVVQLAMTDELITKTIKSLPDTIFKLQGKELIEKIIARRNELPNYALEYYSFIAKTVEVPMSDKTENFNLETDSDGKVTLWVKNIKKTKELGRTLYKRTFLPETTKEIRLYGMGGADQFSFSGPVKSSIKIRAIGGDGEDEFVTSPDFKSKSSLYVYDRSDEPNKLPKHSQAKLRLSKDTIVNSYNSKGFLYDRVGPVFRGNYNIDQGVQVGAGWMSEKQGFRKIPYASKQDFWVDYSTGRKSLIFDYTGNFKKVIGNNDLRVNVNLLGPNNLSNFFGIGNESRFEKIDDDDNDDDETNDKDRDISYYRNRFDYLTTKIELLRQLSTSWRLGLNLATAYYTSSESGNQKRFLKDFNLSDLGQDVFTDKFHVGIGASLLFDTRNNVSVPTKGVYWITEFSAQQQLNDTQKSFEVIKSELSFYLKLPGKDIVLSNKIGGGSTFGSPYFYQLMQLGGVNSLRGFHTRRFAGKSSLYYNLDLRFKLFDFNSYLVPGSVGLTAFNDIGRVWQPKEHSDTWHHGYGGGIYVVPAELILIQAAVGISKEGTLPYISVAFNL
jgi:hypothetical protein